MQTHTDLLDRAASCMSLLFHIQQPEKEIKENLFSLYSKHLLSPYAFDSNTYIFLHLDFFLLL